MNPRPPSSDRRPPACLQAVSAPRPQGGGDGSNGWPLAMATSAGLGTPESDIRKLMDLGFTREKATRALRATNGKVDQAASLLFERRWRTIVQGQMWFLGMTWREYTAL